MKYTDEQIDYYLMGEMSPSEEQAFEDAMRNDPALKNEVELMRGIIQGLRNRQDKKEKISRWIAEADHRRAVSRHTWVPWVSAFSAAAMVVVGVFLFRPEPDFGVIHENEPPQQEYTPGGNVSFKGRSGSNSEIDELINKGEFDDAEALLEQQIKQAEIKLQESKKMKERFDYEVKKNEYALHELYRKRDELQKAQKK